jgi:hypothetical protein
MLPEFDRSSSTPWQLAFCAVGVGSAINLDEAGFTYFAETHIFSGFFGALPNRIIKLYAVADNDTVELVAVLASFNGMTKLDSITDNDTIKLGVLDSPLEWAEAGAGWNSL